ncbi:LuxR family DNA-binding response regulator [Corallococcus coralloides DSM 2259]|uniref:LuxR family DNA-binding response regulator n=1 Tax=Corallococcus coralloides (strain ATCC 25202 / DSM 2259 / NBRC 100086 / M2) TaxID=1144275 RepID=H8MSJ5_CORCM|nr:response regulator transcription factor [Corallococcus coralloides]AFE08555.1 LuxR family DNA-binding response regulator [Corallococcus coralloides DSM 2259]
MDPTPNAAAIPIRVFVVEDQTKILKNQLRLFEGHPDIDIVGTALSGEAALVEVERDQPDVLLLDLGLPRMSGIDVTREVKARFPKVEILIFTIFDEEDKVLEAVKAGASGYLLKGATVDKIVEAIKEVRAGGTVIQPNLARRLLRHFRVEPDTAPVPTEPLPVAPSAAESAPAGEEASAHEPLLKPLSDREREILQLIAKGVSNSEAARLLSLSKATIRTHLEHIYRKLEVTNRVEAVTEGIRKGLISV